MKMPLLDCKICALNPDPLYRECLIRHFIRTPLFGKTFIGAGVGLISEDIEHELCTCKKDSGNTCFFADYPTISRSKIISRVELVDNENIHYIINVVYNSAFTAHILAKCGYARTVKKKPKELEFIKYHLFKTYGTVLANFFMRSTSILNLNDLGRLIYYTLVNIVNPIDNAYANEIGRRFVYYDKTRISQIVNISGRNDLDVIALVQRFTVPNTFVETFETFSHNTMR